MCLSGMCAGKRGDSHDLGYGLRKEFWRKGVCTEACRAVVDKLKQTGISYATATHDVDNLRKRQGNASHRDEISVLLRGIVAA